MRINNGDLEMLAALPVWEMLKGGSILITGATGGLGAYLTLAALRVRERYGLKVFALCRDKKKASAFGQGLTVLLQDVREPLPAGIIFDYVLHTAGPVGPAVFEQSPHEVLGVNVTGTLNMLNHSAKHSCRGFVLASTHEVYGQTDKQVVSEADVGVIDTMTSRAAYPQAKRAAETALVCFYEKYGVRAMSARLSRFYGPLMNLDSGLFICDFVKNVLAGQTVIVRGAANLLRPLSYIADAAAAMLYILAYGQGGRAYNVQSGNPLTIGELALKAAAMGGVPTEFILPETCVLQPEGQLLDASALGSLGFEYQTGIEQGLAKTFEWFR